MRKTVLFSFILGLSILANAQYKPILADDLNDVNQSSGAVIVHSNDSFLYVSCKYEGKTEEIVSINTYDSTIQRTGVTYSVNRNTRNALFFEILDTTYFFAGAELWKTDGSALGTKMISKLDNGPGSLVVHKNHAYFASTSSTLGRELFISDGTKSGTFLLKDIDSGKGSSSPSELTIHNNLIYFTATTPTHGTELWKSDGTENGTVLVKDFKSGSTGSAARSLISYGGELYFSISSDSIKGGARTNGSDTVLVALVDTAKKVINYFTEPAICNDVLFFAGAIPGYGAELFRSEGDPTNTFMIRDMSYQSSNSYPKDLRCVRNLVFFVADVDHGSELFVSDGTRNGTRETRDLYPIQTDAFIKNMTVVDTLLFFTAHESNNYFNFEPYVVKAQYPTRLKDVYPGQTSSNSSSYTAHRKRLFFVADNGEVGAELWTSDGTANGTQLFLDLNAATPSNTGLTSIAAIPNGVMFNANAGFNPQKELWSYSAGSDSAVLVNDFGGSSKTGNPINLTSTSNGIYFSIYEGEFDMEINYYDLKTKSISKILDNGYKNYVKDFTYNNGKLYYTLKQTLLPNIWVYDESNKQTRVLTSSIQPNGFGADAQKLTAVGNLIYFTADNYTEGIELYVTDGTTSGTKLMKDIYSGYYDSRPNYLCNFKDSFLVFIASNPTYGSELYISDGTSSGTKLLKDIAKGSTSGAPAEITAAGDIVLFRANDGIHGAELWVSDGTEVGTKMLLDLDSTSSSTNPSKFKYIKELGLTFFINSDTNKIEHLWVTDGTANGTKKLRSFIDTTYTDNHTMEFLATKEALFFSARTDEYGLELWSSDGTVAGTKMVTDLAKGPESSTPQNLTYSDGYLYFSADDGLVGKELWYMPVSCLASTLSADQLFCKSDSIKPSVSVFRLDDNSALTYNWYINNSFKGSGENFTSALDSVGSGTIKLELTSAKGCKDEQTSTFQVRDIPAVRFDVEKDSQCVNTTYKFNNSSSAKGDAELSYSWSFGDNTSATSLNGSHAYTAGGTKTVKLTVKNYGLCESDASKDIYVLMPPALPSIGGTSSSTNDTEKYYVASPTSAMSTFQWTVSNATILSGQGTDTIVLKWNTRPTTSIIRVKETTADGCVGEENKKTVTVQKPVGIVVLDHTQASVYPNPSTNGSFVLSNTTLAFNSICIYNLQGQIVFNKTNLESSTQLNSDLKSGIYQAVLSGENQSISFKLIVIR
jgi:ELWxxDGT repeat protein